MPKMEPPKMIDKKEAEALIAEYLALAVPCNLIVDAENNPIILLKNQVFVKGKDGGISWLIETTCIGAHFFMFLITGNRRKTKFSLPFCLLDEKSRLAAKALLQTTCNEKGQFNGKDAEFLIVDAKLRPIKVKINLGPLSANYVSLQCVPESYLRELSSQHCPLCSSTQKRDNNDQRIH
jgi:hypothetical protein